MAVRSLRAVVVSAMCLTLAVSTARTLRAQADSTDPVERRAKRARQGAGLRVGMWHVADIGTAANSSWPMFEGYFQKGLDQHLVLETSAGVWRRQLGPGSGAERIFAVPMLTQLKLYPATTPDVQFEPYVSGGIGVTLGVDQNAGAGGGLLGGGGAGGGTQTTVGVGVKGTGGFEYRFSKAFGIAAYAGYQYVYFLNDITTNTASLSGFIVGGGLTYRYQF